ncbi:hypothetical protein 268TH004_24 [Bacillus phage 268TH004]|uniref:Uncharacterized protein n=2 Tax=Gettysburgvirus TaxID=3425034 RepID=A0A7T8C4E8_9CAUD|nr:hypothetical protein 019DV002_23 [Bacillus phage 019DV002]QFG05251.1 hypothetical protein 019DV004_23 [Bacillus phage 019DV004]QQO40369.1 hypothetical protein 268TH004_24 [Bacillus phage 268TH004]
MKKTLVYKREKPITLIYPVNQTFQKGDTLEVNHKEYVEQLSGYGFEEVKTKKKKEGAN